MLAFLRRSLAVALLWAALAGIAPAASPEFVAGVQSELFAGRTEAAAALAETELGRNPADDQARFALGATQFLQAVERLGQGLHRYGLASTAGEGFAGLGVLPILRLPVPPNSNPEKLTYEAFNALLDGFVADLGRAEATLAGIGATPLHLPLDLALIRLDLDGDGQGSADESLTRIFGALTGMPGLETVGPGELLVDFDDSDVPWLRGYCHLLMAIAEFPLAHDWRTAFETTFHGLFPAAELPASPLNDRASAILRDMASPDPQVAIQAQLSQTTLMMASASDLIAFVHLLHWPVTAPERMASVHAHLVAMTGLSRENWRRILAETDDGAEWIPSPRQSGIFDGVEVTEAQVQGWMLFLDEFEALLEGRKLLPHWRFERGINLRRLFLEPTTFDLVLLVQGSAALPYLADGELTTRDTWLRIVSLFGGDFFRYAVWFN